MSRLAICFVSLCDKDLWQVMNKIIYFFCKLDFKPFHIFHLFFYDIPL